MARLTHFNYSHSSCRNENACMRLAFAPFVTIKNIYIYLHILISHATDKINRSGIISAPFFLIVNIAN